MRILVVSQYFPPDMGAPAGRFHDFARQWLAAGHEITVLTGLPHFPAGVVHDEYRRCLYRSEERDGIQVKRCWTWTRPGRGGRPLAYASFLLSACLRILFDWSLRGDVVVATSPPPTVGLAGVLLARTRRLPLVLDIRDIWPEAIVQSGRLTSPLLIRSFEGLARFLYRAADRITTVTHGWRERLVEIGVPAEKIAVLPNGVDIEAFDAQSQDALPDGFAALEEDAHWFTYAGILNAPQGLDIVLDGFAQLRERHPDAYAASQLVLVGEGPREAELRARCRDHALDRVVFVPRQPRAAVFSLLRRSFAVLVTLRPRKDTSTVPSKLYESMASTRPVLYQAGGEGAETIRQAGGGRVVEPGSPEALADAMAAYLAEPARADADGERGRAHVATAFDRRAIAADFAALLQDLDKAALLPAG